ncbi:MAG: argininosuccinate synthase [Leptospiraceae bacterium]|nr:argininosuccinate synthase [Leptospiraceae bacterium]MDW8307630.1 argininosuccinate synthase [Leptospiraceae bacterium]
MEKKFQKIVLAYSGGLDTSVILHWLKREYQCEVIAFCANIGQEEELHGLEEKARRTGASKAYIQDLREEFVRDYVFPMIRSGAIYEGRYLLGTSIARPLIAKHLIEVAKQEDAQAIAHGATGKGNDQVRFEVTVMALAPHLTIIAPWRIWDFKGRSDLIAYAKKEGIPVSASVEKPYSIDRNALHISYEGGILEDPWQEPPEDMFLLTKSIKDTPVDAEYIEIEFQRGNPIKLNGELKTPYEMLKSLNDIGARHGIGRVDMVENRLVGIKSRGVYETPGGTILHLAHRDLESITLERNLQHLKDSLSLRYAELVYNGLWFSPEREALQAFVDDTQKVVNGTVRIKLHKGSALVVGRKSGNSLYDHALASFEKEEVYNQKDAEGFIRLYGLGMRNGYPIYQKFKS